MAMVADSKKIMIIAGEVSGDLIGGSLVKELKRIDSHLEILGIGGDKMKSSGMKLLYHIDQMAFLGFVEVIKHLPFIRKVQKNILRIIKEEKIRNVVLIDYPGFNLSIAKKLKAIGIKIIYYVSPQLWAWGSGRLNKIRSLVDKMLVVFPFEEKFYKDNNLDVQFVGHPLSERVKEYEFLSREKFFTKFNLENDKEILLLMPGSREQEVIKIFNPIIDAANLLALKFNLQIVVAASSNIDDELFNKLTGHRNFKVIKNHNYDLMRHAKMGIIKSGTSTLEAGYFELPMIIVYKTNRLTYLVGKRMIKIDKIGMVNILLDEKVIPELIQKRVNKNYIYKESKKLISDSDYYLQVKEKLRTVKDKLGKDRVSVKAAEIIYSAINES
jgi:lipid-A-disaccharide synthase